MSYVTAILFGGIFAMHYLILIFFNFLRVIKNRMVDDEGLLKKDDYLVQKRL